MRKMKKFLATLTATAMLFSTMTVMAAEDTTAPASGEITAEGELEEYLEKDVFSVVLPTVNEISFVLDPQGLLHVADEDLYTGGTGAAYFDNTVSGSNVKSFSDTSNPIIIRNKSSYDVDVKLNLEVTTEDIALVTSGDLATAAAPSMYLGLTVSDGSAASTATVTGSDYVAATKTVAAVPVVDGSSVTKGYEIDVTSGDSPSGYSYSYKLTDDFTDADAKYIGYNLTAACNNVEGWKSVDTKVSAKIVWSCDKTGGTSVVDAYALDDGTAVYVAMAPFVGDTSPNPGFEGATASDVTNLYINSKSVTPVISYDYLTLDYAVFDGTTAPYVIKFTYKGTNYQVTLEQ